ncbi:ABC transporter C family member 7-like [Arachis ipaensis]|uniref:ABC transporter C family member 7-like n=1 Tax=Arachis ipaensis TaxID=130454 RepID=UPI000A2B5780|nr:ABC transporter C family member 7-like [Arachis ipaensis]
MFTLLLSLNFPVFPSTSTMAIVDTLLVTANVAFFYAILIWLLLHTLRQSKLQRAVFLQQRPKFFSIITLLFNFILTLLTIAFAVHEYRTNKIVRYSSVTFALTWVMASLVSFYSMKKTTRDNKRFPFVLVLWWVLTSIIEAISISIGLMKNNFEYLDFWNFFSEDDNIVGVVSLPMLLLLLCLNLCAREEQHNTDMEQLLVHPGEEDDDDDEDGENFTTVGIWSQLTFRWLNPIFRKGRVQKLELAHIPDVPHSETAENASSLLEESLGKQKLEGDSLTKAITSSVWKSLALNAVFAGIFYYSLDAMYFFTFIVYGAY